MSSQCFICPQPGKFRCPQCDVVLFCSETHGEYHVMSGGPCHPFTLSEGRLVSSRAVMAGETVLREKPAVLAPSGELRETGHCLVCLASLNTETCLLCDGCDFPLCDHCEGDSSHLQDCHHLATWAAISYSPLLPHRLLQLRLSQPGLYHDLLSLNNPGRPSEMELEVMTGLQHQHQVTREEVEAVMAVLETHSLSLAPGIRGLYYLTSLLPSSQENNCQLVLSQHQPHIISLQATRDMKEGEELTLPPTHQILEVLQSLNSIQAELRILNSDICQGKIPSQVLQKVSKDCLSRLEYIYLALSVSSSGEELVRQAKSLIGICQKLTEMPTVPGQYK